MLSRVTLAGVRASDWLVGLFPPWSAYERHCVHDENHPQRVSYSALSIAQCYYPRKVALCDIVGGG